jgi:hypothetical protein
LAAELYLLSIDCKLIRKFQAIKSFRSILIIFNLRGQLLKMFIDIFAWFVKWRKSLRIKHRSFNKIFYSKVNQFLRFQALNLEIKPLKISVSIRIWPHKKLIVKIFPLDSYFQITALEISLKYYLLLSESDFIVEFIKYNILQLFGNYYLGTLLTKIIIEFKVLIELVPTLSGFGGY